MAVCSLYGNSHAAAPLASLAELVHPPVEIGRHPELRTAIDLLGGEVSDRRPAGLGRPQALRDPEVAAGLEALHEHSEARSPGHRPGRPWTAGTLRR